MGKALACVLIGYLIGGINPAYILGRMTGKDQPVIDFIESNGEAAAFLNNAFNLVDAHIGRFLERGFTHLQVCFGCTGGQHRSVYCAEKMADHISQKFGQVNVELIHRERQ